MVQDERLNGTQDIKEKVREGTQKAIAEYREAFKILSQHDRK